jgi:hypothetical protein
MSKPVHASLGRHGAESDASRRAKRRFLASETTLLRQKRQFRRQGDRCDPERGRKMGFFSQDTVNLFNFMPTRDDESRNR